MPIIGRDISSRHLQAAVAVARYGSFMAAAAYLGISQPALTRTVQQLERLLGVSLFSRSSRHVALTAAGRAFVPAAERLLGELRIQMENMRELADQQRGYLVVASLMSIAHHVLPSAIGEYRRRHPGVELQIREGVQGDVYEDVRSAVADFGIGNTTEVYEPIETEALGQEACHVALQRHHRLAAQAAVSIRELQDEPLISMPPEAGIRRLVDRAAADAGVRIRHAITLNQFATLYDFVRCGLGIAVVPAPALPPPDDPVLVSRPLRRPAITRRIGILTLAGRPLSPAAKGFLQVFKACYAAATGR